MSSPAWLQWFLENRQHFQGDFLLNEPLSRHTYYRIGGPTPLLVVPKSTQDLEWIQRGIQATQAPFVITGLGSNLLVADQGLNQLVIKCSKLQLSIQVDADDVIRCGASVSVSTLLRKAAQEGWGGLEWMTGIPGSLGGVVFMNAGTHLGEAAQSLQEVHAFDFLAFTPVSSPWKKFSGSELKFEYRKNHFLNSSTLIFETLWKIKKGDPTQIKTLIDETLLRRKSTQPLEHPSCGSVFKNPPQMKAWEVIEKLGLRSHQIGGAQFSQKHPNFIVNLGDALATDVWGLIQLAQARAKKELGVELHPEVKFLE